MREICTYGSVRGARSNARPYRDPRFCDSAREGAAPESPKNPISTKAHSAKVERRAAGLQCGALGMNYRRSMM